MEQELSRQEIIRRAILDRYERPATPRRLQTAPIAWWSVGVMSLDRLGFSVTEVEYLTLEDPLGLVRRLDLGPVRDLGLLDSAITRPQSSAFDEDTYPTVRLKAAALCTRS